MTLKDGITQFSTKQGPLKTKQYQQNGRVPSITKSNIQHSTFTIYIYCIYYTRLNFWSGILEIQQFCIKWKIDTQMLNWMMLYYLFMDCGKVSEWVDVYSWTVRENCQLWVNKIVECENKRTKKWREERDDCKIERCSKEPHCSTPLQIL